MRSVPAGPVAAEPWAQLGLRDIGASSRSRPRRDRLTDRRASRLAGQGAGRFRRWRRPAVAPERGSRATRGCAAQCPGLRSRRRDASWSRSGRSESRRLRRRAGEGGPAHSARTLAPSIARTSSTLRESRTNEGAQHLTGELRVVRTSVAERVRERQHPLPKRDRGQDAIDPVRRRICHAASSVPWTQAAAVAREGDQAVVDARTWCGRSWSHMGTIGSQSTNAATYTLAKPARTTRGKCTAATHAPIENCPARHHRRPYPAEVIEDPPAGCGLSGCCNSSRD